MNIWKTTYSIEAVSLASPVIDIDGIKGIHVGVLLLATGTILPTVTVCGTALAGCHSRITAMSWDAESPKMPCSAHGCFVRSRSFPLAPEAMAEDIRVCRMSVTSLSESIPRADK